MEVTLRVPWSVFLLRSACLAALAASAALTADALHPDRAFCPLEAACAAARSSALGTLFGLPTSVFGILAFLGLFLMTLLPPRLARVLARPAAWGAAAMRQAPVGFFCFAFMGLFLACGWVLSTRARRNAAIAAPALLA